MILERLEIDRADFERATGWTFKPEGACKGDVCVPLPGDTGGALDVRTLAERLGMPLVADDAAGVWALGPEALAGRALTTAVVPEIVLPDVDGNPFALSSLRGTKVLVLAWASW